MKDKKKFEEPEFIVINFISENLITASGDSAKTLNFANDWNTGSEEGW